MPAGKRHFDERSALAVEPKHRFQEQQHQDAADPNCPADMMATMMTCVPEMPQMVSSDGSRSPRSSVAHMTSISSPGSAVQTANV